MGVVMIVGTLGQAVAGESFAINILGVLIMWRFVSIIEVGRGDGRVRLMASFDRLWELESEVIILSRPVL